MDFVSFFLFAYQSFWSLTPWNFFKDKLLFFLKRFCLWIFFPQTLHRLSSISFWNVRVTSTYCLGISAKTETDISVSPLLAHESGVRLGNLKPVHFRPHFGLLTIFELKCVSFSSQSNLVWTFISSGAMEGGVISASISLWWPQGRRPWEAVVPVSLHFHLLCFHGRILILGRQVSQH